MNFAPITDDTPDNELLIRLALLDGASITIEPGFPSEVPMLHKDGVVLARKQWGEWELDYNEDTGDCYMPPYLTHNGMMPLLNKLDHEQTRRFMENLTGTEYHKYEWRSSGDVIDACCAIFNATARQLAVALLKTMEDAK